MMKNLLACCILLFVSQTLLAQETEDKENKENVIILNSKDVDPHRYDDVKGSPYFFKNFVKGNIIASSADSFQDMLLNYNGYTKEFEVRDGNKYIELNKSVYMRVEVLPEENPDLHLKFPLIFQKGFQLNWLNKFGILIYSGKHIKFIRDVDVVLSEKVLNDVGKTVKFKSFYDKGDYYFLIDGELSPIKLREKKILDALGHGSELQKYAKENDIDLGTEEGIRKILPYWESL